MRTQLVWRPMLYVPSNNPSFIGKAHARGADAIILDLEDIFQLKPQIKK